MEHVILSVKLPFWGTYQKYELEQVPEVSFGNHHTIIQVLVLTLGQRMEEEVVMHL